VPAPLGSGASHTAACPSDYEPDLGDWEQRVRDVEFGLISVWSAPPVNNVVPLSIFPFVKLILNESFQFRQFRL